MLGGTTFPNQGQSIAPAYQPRSHCFCHYQLDLDPNCFVSPERREESRLTMLNASATLDAPRAKLTCTFPEETIRGPLTSQCGGNAVSAECGNTWRRIKDDPKFHFHFS